MLFPEDISLDLPDSDIKYYPDFFNKKEADAYFNSLLKHINWQQDDITVFGKTYKQPRLTALFGNNGKPYSYSNITMHPHVFTEELQQIKDKVETKVNTKFTTCLANLYRNGNDSNGWHADNEIELGKNPIIASVSFGAERYFHLKHRHDKSLKQKLLLQHGSLLLMQGKTQHHWLHQIAKTKKDIGLRINLTFRIIK
ncbi:alpha-ketoglutarate-dependent dioxygenase AlkB [Mesoflavibacter sp. SCSIO 43206]|uniref:alpha-ketoglutarate-dependent dioxygenase AlkB family protein n=1 Tax=Mesoflavibacter sp. SCSIO 43206 TaxID=2779362 RepID=UPI001CA89885|nr:alpha-ketoglutarate-dependent dioxygenase AlkB [Mesoflavibacter sp. SCSIO 43206]UAB75768.1 alpha-ketoglutarate-dependent dioxygenase AlkB [Mesoflavibacter sp. SCSIO 43206]